MCTKKGCDRHEFDRGLCLPHLKAEIEAKEKAEARPTRKRAAAKKTVAKDDETKGV